MSKRRAIMRELERCPPAILLLAPTDQLHAQCTKQQVVDTSSGDDP